MADLFENPLGTDGFAFVEYTGEPEKLDKLFRDFGVTPIAKHKKRDVTLYRQGSVNFLLNRETGGQSGEFAHGQGVSVAVDLDESIASRCRCDCLWCPGGLHDET